MEESERPVVRDIGMTVLYEPQDGIEVAADLCFVHGLGGHPQKTWSFRKLPESKSAKASWRQRLSFKKRDTESVTKPDAQEAPAAGSKTALPQGSQSFCYWPFDLVPKEFPNVRVLSYGYDSHPTHFYKHKTTQLTISQHSLDLLAKVTNARTKARGRPLIFIAHGLGGVIVKDMTIESRKHKAQPDMRDAADSLRAIIFFGTPHLGAPSAEWGQILTNIVGVVGVSTYKGVLRGLSPDSEKLAGINRDFNDILDEYAAGQRKFDIYNFQEGRPLTGLKLFDGKVVPDYSSWLNRRAIERVAMIQDADHMSMCRFKSANDAGFQDFGAALGSYLLSGSCGQNTVPSRVETSSTPKEPDLLQSLDFDQRLVRAQHIGQTQTFKQSFGWIWSSNFAAWFQTDQPVFWICGHPASGKSTLINHLMWDERVRRKILDMHDEKWTLIYHFFDYRAGTGIANNFNGFWQSILIQILHSVPYLKDLVSSQYCRKVQLTPHHSWTLSELNYLLELVCADSSLRFCLFIDGLDEYSGSMVELVSFVNQIGSATRKICIASRPDPPLPDAFRHVPTLMMHILNRPGIQAFVSSTLSPYLSAEAPLGRASIEKFSSDIVARANGVFLWARFAVMVLVDGVTRGQSNVILQRRLEDVPEQLTEIYARILMSRTSADRVTVGLMLRLTSDSFHPLTVQELYQALGLVTQSDTDIMLWLKEYSHRHFVRSINAVSGSLLEVVGVQASRDRHLRLVRTIHRTVQTYLEEAGWRLLQGDTDYHVLADELWLRACVEALKRSRLSNLSDRDVAHATSRKHINLTSVCSGIIGTTKSGDQHRTPATRFNTSEIGFLEKSIAGIRDYALAYLLNHAHRYEHLTKRSTYLKIGSVMSQASFVSLHGVAWTDKTCEECKYIQCIGKPFESHLLGQLPTIAIAHGFSLFTRDVLRNDPYWTQMTRGTLEERKDHENEALERAKKAAPRCVNRPADTNSMEIMEMLLHAGSSLDDADIAETILEGTPDSVRFILQYLPSGLLKIQSSSERWKTNPWWSSRVGPLFLITLLCIVVSVDELCVMALIWLTSWSGVELISTLRVQRASLLSSAGAMQTRKPPK